MTSEAPIFHYTDYRRFLKERLAELKRRNPKFSHRFINQRLGIRSAGWLSDILAGRKALQPSYAVPLGKVMGLVAREQEYLEALVAYNEATGLAERERAYEKLARFHEVPAELVDRDRFAYFAKWHHAAIRELLVLEPWDGRVESIEARLEPKVPVAEIRESVALLERMGFLRKLAAGRWEAATPHVRKEKSDFGKVHYYQFIRNAIELGQRAAERFPENERDVSALVAPLDEIAFAEVREELRALRKKIIALSEKSVERHGARKPTVPAVPFERGEVFQFLLQMFPVTTTGERAVRAGGVRASIERTSGARVPVRKAKESP